MIHIAINMLIAGGIFIALAVISCAIIAGEDDYINRRF